MSSFEERAQELREAAERVEVLGRVHSSIENSMHWDCCKLHEADEEHEDTWFTAPDEDDSWRYPKYVVYQEVLDMVMNLANKVK